MREMTSLERVRCVLRGETPDRLPVIPQSFLFSAETAGYKIGQINRNAALLAQSHIVCQERYGYDGCVIDVDDATLAEACGARVIYRENDVAAVDENEPLLDDLRAIDDLTMPDPQKDGRLPLWLETTERLVSAIGDHVFVMGRADQGPFDLLCLLRGTENFMIDLITEEADVIRHALEWTKEAHIRFAKAQIAAGAHATSMGDSYASPNLVAPRVYRDFALQPEIDVVAAVQSDVAPYAIHICGDTTMILEDMATTGAAIVELDWKVDMAKARQIFPNNVAIMGNIDPSAAFVFGAPEVVDALAKRIIETTKGRGLLLSSGCALGANTKPENMTALVAAAAKYGRYEQLMGY